MVNTNIDEYIEEICSYVKFKKAHKEIKTEILSHIEEKTEDLILEGIAEEEASKKAVADMGQAEMIGKQLNQSHKAAPEWSVLIITVLFSLLGLTVSYLIDTNGIVYYSVFFQNTALFSAIGYIVLVGLYYFDYKKLENHSRSIFIGITLVLLIHMLFALPVNGRKAWMTLGPLTINITEISLFLYVISLSKLIRNLDLTGIKRYVYLSLMLGVPFSIFVLLNVSMAALTYLVLFTVLMFNSKVKRTYIFSAIGVFLAGLFYTAFSAAYRVKRLLIFINPESDAQGAGFLNVQIQKLLSSVGIMGKGLNFPKGTIPEVQNDFVLTYIIYTFGWLAAIVFIGLVFIFIVRLFSAAKAVKDTYGRFIIQGFVCVFALEFIWNILMILGLVPIVSVSLPFISYGGSSLLTHMAAVGIIMSIYKSKSLSFAC